MTVEPWQLQTNAVLDVDGSKGFVRHSSGGVTVIGRENGRIEYWTTESVAENGKVHEDSPIQPAPDPQPQPQPPQPQPPDQPTQQPTDQPAAPTGVNDPQTPITGENRQQTP